MRWGLLAVGSLVGGFGRYALAGWVHRVTAADFPYGTLVVNVAGCFLIGIFDALAETKFALSPENRLLLMTGFCGAFTTFSTFILDSVNLAKEGEILRATSNIALSVVLGGLAFLLAERCIKLI